MRSRRMTESNENKLTSDTNLQDSRIGTACVRRGSHPMTVYAPITPRSHTHTHTSNKHALWECELWRQRTYYSVLGIRRDSRFSSFRSRTDAINNVITHSHTVRSRVYTRMMHSLVVSREPADGDRDQYDWMLSYDNLHVIRPSSRNFSAVSLRLVRRAISCCHRRRPFVSCDPR